MKNVKPLGKILMLGEILDIKQWEEIMSVDPPDKPKPKFKPKSKPESKSVDQEAKVFEANRYYAQNPWDFTEDFFQVTCDPWQKDAFRALLDYHYVAIRSGSGVGKTAWISMALIWFLRTHPMCKIPATAPSQHQLFDLLWSECFRWINRSQDLSKTLSWTQTRISVRGYEAAWYAVARTAVTKTASQDETVAEGLQGFHSEDNLLFVVDEASGVPDTIFPAIEGALTNENSYCIMPGNPTRRSGYFFDIFHKPKTGKMYHKIHISCLDTPRVSQRYVDMMLERYGENHPIYRIKVLGEFAEAGDDQLIPLEYIETMQNNTRDETVSPKLPIEIGIDLGRSNALSIATIRQGTNILKFVEQQREKGSITEAQEAIAWVRSLVNDFDPSIVRIDATGLGAPICDFLVEIYGDKIFPFIGAAVAKEPKLYINLRAESYWLLRQKVPKLWAAYWPDKLIHEMSDLRKKESNNGKLQIESKKEMMARAMRSPDHFDSMMYAFASNCDEIVDVAPARFSSKIISINDKLTTKSIWQSSTNARWNGSKQWA